MASISKLAIFDGETGKFTLDLYDETTFIVENHPNIRSTEIRNLVKNGLIEEAKKLVPEAAYDLLNFYKE